MKKIVLLALVACGPWACSSSAPEIDYYTLGTRAGVRVEAPVNVSVDRLLTTEALARRGIMVSPSDTRVAYHGTSQWAEGLGGLVQRRLAAAFGPPLEGRRTVRLSGTVLSCGEVVRSGERLAKVELEVEVREAGSSSHTPPLLARTYGAELPETGSGEDVDGLVRALGLALDRIAAAIARDLGDLAPPAANPPE